MNDLINFVKIITIFLQVSIFSSVEAKCYVVQMLKLLSSLLRELTVVDLKAKNVWLKGKE